MFSCINVRQVPREMEMLKPRTTALVGTLDQSIDVEVCCPAFLCINQ